MAIITSKIDTNSELFSTNALTMQSNLDLLTTLSTRIEEGGGEKAQQRQKDKGKLPVRERISQLLDDGSPFLEVGKYAALKVYEEDVPCAGVVAGIGHIYGQECMIIANDPTVKGGTYYPITVKKHLRAQDIAEKCHIPCVYLVDSGGANLPRQDEVFPDRDHFGRIFYNQARMSAKGIPQIAVVLGLCTAGGAYVPAMSDVAIMVKQQGTIFLAGPPLVKAATGEIVSSEDLGGADVHCRHSGVADYLADNEQHALLLARQAIQNCGLPPKDPTTKNHALPPRYDAKEMYGIINHDLRIPFDAREIIARLVDDSDFDEFKALYGKSLICGFAKLGGHLIGIVANNGILFSESALKGAHFITLCAKRKIPLLFLQNVTGFMVGKRYEAEGIAKHGAKMVMAVACADVPKFTVVIGGSYGAGNYAMCGRSYDPTMMWMWPNAKIAVMGGNQAAGVMAQVTQSIKERQGEQWSEADKNAFMQPIIDMYDQQASPLYASARLWDDGIIDPAQTRNVLIQALNAALNQEISDSDFGIFRM